jgi:S-DNA-T family DNA segregation ATPase FtsK/SpoIIIE
MILHLDRYAWKFLKLAWLYPKNPWFLTAYVSFGALSGFLVWGIGQAILKRKLVTQLTEAFLASGLKTPLGKLPSFVFDKPIDAVTRKLRLKRQYLSVKQFKDARPSLESALQIYIDTIHENRVQGSVDIVYSHFPMDELVELDDIKGIPKETFVIGRSRSQEIQVSLASVPHFLVAGQTGGGKSTFLRQMITSLYLNNPSFQFRLIDLKGGLEFQIFENLNRIKVVPDVAKAIALIRSLEKSLVYRMETLKLNGCKDIKAFFAKPMSERKYPTGQYREDISRTLVVIDEVAELFMATSEMKSKEVQEAKRVIWKIAAQGRAVGLHLVVATQRPDVKALDSQVKTHLIGVVCFQMVNDASSMTVLGNGRATDLPRIPGRAIWKSELDMIEIQTPFISPEIVTELLKTQDSESKAKTGKDDEASVKDPGVSASDVPLEMESSNNDSTGNEVLSESQASECSPKTP